ncbi:MAG: transglutaminase-like domain-containing protein [Nanobdellota archaeon]
MRWIALLVLISISHAAYLDYSHTEATWEITLNGTLDIPSGVSDMESYLRFDNDPPSNQKLESVKPVSGVGVSYSNGSYLYWWQDKPGQKHYGLSFVVTIQEVLATDTGTPIMEDSPYIDSSPKLKTLARTLEAKDPYKSIYNILHWINQSVEVTESGQAKASQVLSLQRGNEFGVIAVFMALTREMNIPSRFVYGLAYDEENITNPHIWAEVTDQWIPVDVLNQQVGVLDISHIKLYDSPDLQSKIARHQADGESIEIPEMDVTAVLASQTGNRQPKLNMELNPYLKDMGPLSYNLLEMVITNPLDKPFMATFRLPSDGIEIIEQPDPFIYLPPKSQQQFHYIIRNQVPVEEMPSPIEAEETGRHILLRNPLQTNLTTSEDGEVLSLEYIRNLGDVHIIPHPQEAKPTITNNITQSGFDIDDLIDQFNKTSQVIDVKKVIKYDNETNTTSVYINITPKNNLENVSVYEEIPKCLTEIIQNVQPREVDFEVVNPDPLIVWNFDEVNDSITISYDVLKTLKNISCQDETATMTVAQAIGDEIGDEGGHMVYIIIAVLFVILVGSMVMYRKLSE